MSIYFILVQLKLLPEQHEPGSIEIRLPILLPVALLEMITLEKSLIARNYKPVRNSAILLMNLGYILISVDFIPV